MPADFIMTPGALVVLIGSPVHTVRRRRVMHFITRTFTGK
jgi:hypothetical protein